VVEERKIHSLWFAPTSSWSRESKLPKRRTYKLWEEGEVPSLVIEVTSNSTRREDTRDKKDLYERLGVKELILYDPLGERRG